MKPASLLLLIIIIVLTLILPGCTAAVNSDISSAIPSEPLSTTAPSYDAPKITAKPTPVITTSPETTLTPVPAKSPKTTPTASAKPSPKPAKDEEKVVIAEGFYYIKLNDKLKKRITGMSYPKDDEDCQVTYDDLRYIKLLHYDFEGEVKEGELIVNKKVAKDVTEIFYELYKEKYALASVKLVDDFGQPGHDTLSMEANNSSAYCYRRVNRSKKMSHHSFGAAVDINPMLNPYVNGDRVSPKNSVDYLDRTKDFAGKIDHDDLCYKLFKKHGWKWGGEFSDPDYQHFYKDSLGYDRLKP